MTGAPDWPALVVALGADVRRLRELLGWSQDRLARVAHVSQGAVSRLEYGRGLHLPLLTAWKVIDALAASLVVLEWADAAAPRTRALLSLTVGLAEDDPAVLDPHLTALVAAFHRVPERRRALFVAAVVPVATALTDVSP